MAHVIPVFVLLLILLVIFICCTVKIVRLCIKALQKYIGSKEVREEKKQTCRSLGEALQEHRKRCHMTQEFVAESLGVSRQAVSKWENGAADPSTTNLLALAKLYGISPEELLREVIL